MKRLCQLFIIIKNLHYSYILAADDDSRKKVILLPKKLVINNIMEKALIWPFNKSWPNSFAKYADNSLLIVRYKYITD